MQITNETAFLEGILNYEKDTSFVVIKGADLSFPDYTHMKIFNELKTVSPSAYHSINNQIQVSGVGFTDLSELTKTEIYNEVLKSERLIDKEFLLILVNDQVKAMMVHAQDKRSYSYIETSKVLDILVHEFEELGLPLVFRDGVLDDYYTVAHYKVNHFYHRSYSFSFLMVKSNTGYSSLKITPVISKGDFTVHLKLDEISLEHKGDMVEKISGSAKKLHSIFLRITKRLDELQDEPLGDVFEFCRNKGINIRTAKFIKKNFKGDTLQELLDFLENIDFSGPHGEPKEVMLGNLLNK